MKSAQHVLAHARTASSLGPLLLAASEQGLCGLWSKNRNTCHPGCPHCGTTARPATQC